jgi:glucose/arabinose dehydrogenase
MATVIGVFLVGLGLAWFMRGWITQYIFAPTTSPLPVVTQQADLPEPDVAVVASNLEIPWEVAFLPDGDLLVTERPGRLVRIGQQGATFEIAGVEHVGEGGLQGLALDPSFTENGWLYLYLTTRSDSRLINRIERYRLAGDQLSDKTLIFDNIPGAQYHDGGRIEFGPDGYLYVAVGDAVQPEWAQDPQNLAGSILRITADGSIPADNPFGNAVWSYGHRNAQGLAWDDQGRLWSTEHGRSGVRSGYDELNLIASGQNYGWPVVEGDANQEGMVAPAAHSGADDTWAPAGMVYWDGSLWFAGLRGASLYEAVINEAGQVTDMKAHFRGDFGRLRAVQLGPDGSFYLTTSNRDGRGPESPGDDKVIRINPAALR